jgi:hypothetical protein
MLVLSAIRIKSNLLATEMLYTNSSTRTVLCRPGSSKEALRVNTPKVISQLVGFPYAQLSAPWDKCTQLLTTESALTSLTSRRTRKSRKALRVNTTKVVSQLFESPYAQLLAHWDERTQLLTTERALISLISRRRTCNALSGGT